MFFRTRGKKPPFRAPGGYWGPKWGRPQCTLLLPHYCPKHGGKFTPPLPAASTFSQILSLTDDSDRVLGLPLPDASRLRQLPNPDQAYLIRPAALDEKGLYYGVQTLKQLLAPFIRGGRVLVPLAVVTDWPDLEERGLWNSGRETPGFVPWLAGLKLNFEHIPHPVSFKPGEERCPPPPRAEIEAARSRAFHLLPHCAHYDFWRDHNREHYPAELAGKGETARHLLLHPRGTPRG